MANTRTIASTPSMGLDPRILSGLSGLGSMFSTIANNQRIGATHVDPIQAGMQNMQATQKTIEQQQNIENFKNNVNNLSPEKKALALSIIRSDNPAAMASLFSALSKPAKADSWTAPQSVVGADGKMHLVQINNATGAVRTVPGVTPASKGIRLSTGPNGIQFEQGTFPGTTVDGQSTGIVQDPTKSPSRGGQGGVYRDPATGQSYVTNPSAQQQQDVTTISAVKRVEPQIEDLMDKLPQFQSKWKQLENYGAGVLNQYVPGVDIDLPSQEKEGKSVLLKAPESLLKAYGINNFTEKNVDDFRQVLAPDPKESRDGYKRRILRFLDELKSQLSQSMNRINYGTKLTGNSNIPTYNPLTDKWS